MNKLGPVTAMFLLALLLSYTGSLSAFAQTEYIDPLVGNDYNPGLSGVTAKRSSGYDIPERTIEVPRTPDLGIRRAAAIEVGGASSQPESEWERIVLGPKAVNGWEAFAPNIWQAPLYLAPDYTLQSVKVDGVYFQMGCTSDFIGDMQFFQEANLLYINDPEGNPDVVGKTITASLYNDQTEDYLQMTIVNWSAVLPTVWQAAILVKPMHVLVSNQMYDAYRKWWWGPLYCEEQTGEDGFLYLRDADGNPDTMGKQVEAIVNTGGWGVTSGDFNGDGLSDVVHSNSGPEIFINYGALDFDASAVQILSSPEEQDVFGFFVASAGDVNNDGYDELLVSMDWGDDNVYLFMGSASGINSTPSLQLVPPVGITGYGFGHSIAGNGDINGDNFSDILIMGGDETASYLCVYLGSAAGIPSLPDSTIQFPDKVYDGSLCFPGDMNGDGFDEVAVAMKDKGIPANQIEVAVFNGSQTANLSNPKILQFTIPETTAHISANVASAGDINADGFADLIVGNQWAEGDETGNAREGKAYLFLGSEAGPSSMPDQEIGSPIPGFNIRFGGSVSGIGDIDRDGFDDVAVGCPYGEDGLGFIAVYGGSAAGIKPSPLKIITGINNFGWSISGAGNPKGLDQAFLLAGEEFGSAYLYALPCDTLYYPDTDGDGYGDANSDPSCMQHPGYVADKTDCDDGNINIHPGAAESCNSIDDNCNGSIDEGVTNTYYRDSDGDGFGNPDITAQACSPPTGYVEDNSDCDDDNINIHPGATEIPDDGIDQDCNGSDLTTSGDQDNTDSILAYGGSETISFASASGTILSNCQAMANPSPTDSPAELNFPYGLFSFTIYGVTPGGSTIVVITLPDGSNPASYYMYGPTPDNPSDHWYEFSYDGETGAEINGNIITLHFVDGKSGDSDRNAANGTIVDPGGPTTAVAPDDTPAETSDTGGGGGGGCFMESVIQ